MGCCELVVLWKVTAFPWKLVQGCRLRQLLARLKFHPQTNLTSKREGWAGKWFIKCSSCHGVGSGIDLSSVCVCYQTRTLIWEWMEKVKCDTVSIWNSFKTYSLKHLPTHIPHWMFCSRDIPLFAFSLLSFQHSAEDQGRSCCKSHICARAGGAAPVCAIWESGSKEADAQCFMGFPRTSTSSIMDRKVQLQHKCSI